MKCIFFEKNVRTARQFLLAVSARKARPPVATAAAVSLLPHDDTLPGAAPTTCFPGLAHWPGKGRRLAGARLDEKSRNAPNLPRLVDVLTHSASDI